jgi:Reverse transcriptase (RNA-dependent DNA polymerase)
LRIAAEYFCTLDARQITVLMFCHFLNLDTHHIIISRDVTWLAKNYGQWKGIAGVVLPSGDTDDEMHIDCTHDDLPNVNNNDTTATPDLLSIANNINNNNNFDPNILPNNPVTEIEVAAVPNTKVFRAMKKITGLFNPDANQVVTSEEDIEEQDQDEGSEDGNEGNEDDEDGKDGNDSSMSPSRLTDSENIMLDRYSSDFDIALSAFTNDKSNPDKIAIISYKDVYDIPHNFNQAWAHPNNWQKSKWRESVNLELDKMAQYEVWQVVQRSRVLVPPNRRCVKHKWILILSATVSSAPILVAYGYSQIPGVDFLEAYSPVINDVAFRVMLIIQMLWRLSAKIIDVETAFLHGELEEKVSLRTGAKCQTIF